MLIAISELSDGALHCLSLRSHRSTVQNFHESSQSALMMPEELVLNLHLLPFLIPGAACQTHGGQG